MVFEKIDIGNELDEVLFVEFAVRVLGDFGGVKTEEVKEFIDDIFFVGIEVIIMLRFDRGDCLSEVESAGFERGVFEGFWISTLEHGNNGWWGL